MAAPGHRMAEKNCKQSPDASRNYAEEKPTRAEAYPSRSLSEQKPTQAQRLGAEASIRHRVPRYVSRG